MNAHADPATAPRPNSGSPTSGSPVRLIVLIGLLLLAVGGLAYDFFVAGPQSEKAYEEILKMYDTKNEKSISDGGIVKSDDVKQIVGFAPTYTQREKDYTVEWYCWWGKIPVLTTWKRYITVVYGPSGTFVSHHKNEPPAAESLGVYTVSKEGEGASTDMPAAENFDSAADGGAEGKSGRGKGTGAKEGDVSEEKPAGDKPAGDKPAGDKPAEDKPAEDKPAEDKPAEDKPAEDKPAESKSEEAPKADAPAAAEPKSDP
jgi:hypothetical protein